MINRTDSTPTRLEKSSRGFENEFIVGVRARDPKEHLKGSPGWDKMQNTTSTQNTDAIIRLIGDIAGELTQKLAALVSNLELIADYQSYGDRPYPSLKPLPRAIGLRPFTTHPSVLAASDEPVQPIADLRCIVEEIERQAWEAVEKTITLEMAFGSAGVDSNSEVTKSGMSPMRPQSPPTATSVLVVEDDPEVLEIACLNLSDMGYRTISATNGADALKYLRGSQPIDLLFSDVIMPGALDGIQLAREARGLRPDLKVLLTSGHAGEALPARETLPPGSPVILAKPYGREQLARMIAATLSQA